MFRFLLACLPCCPWFIYKPWFLMVNWRHVCCNGTLQCVCLLISERHAPSVIRLIFEQHYHDKFFVRRAPLCIVINVLVYGPSVFVAVALHWKPRKKQQRNL